MDTIFMRFENSKRSDLTITQSLTLFRMDFFRAAHGCGGGFLAPPLRKIRHTNPAMMKLGTVMPYLGKFQKLPKSRFTPLGFC